MSGFIHFRRCPAQMQQHVETEATYTCNYIQLNIRFRKENVELHRRNTKTQNRCTDLHGPLIKLRPDCWQCPAMRTCGQHKLNHMSGNIYTKQTQKGKLCSLPKEAVISIFFTLIGQHSASKSSV